MHNVDSDLCQYFQVMSKGGSSYLPQGWTERERGDWRSSGGREGLDAGEGVGCDGERFPNGQGA